MCVIVHSSESSQKGVLPKEVSVYVTVHVERVIFALCKHLSTVVLKNFCVLSLNLRLYVNIVQNTFI